MSVLQFIAIIKLQFIQQILNFTQFFCCDEYTRHAFDLRLQFAVYIAI